MANLTTQYLNLPLTTPLVVSSNPLCADVDNICQMAEMGAGAVILPSLFEEQINLEDARLDWYRGKEDFFKPEVLKKIPDLRKYNRGIGGYLAIIYQAKQATHIPIIGSLNGHTHSGWIRFANLIEGAGADAIELNLYHLPTETYVSGEEVEAIYLRLVEAVREQVRIPVVVKLNPFFSSIPNMAKRLADAGADGLVLFNRFYQPSFDLETESALPQLNYSNWEELLLRLRWTAILYGRVSPDLGITGGVHSGLDALKCIYAGANVAMVASAVLMHGIEFIQTLLEEMNNWLDAHHVDSLDSVRGRMSHAQINKPENIERVDYIQTLSFHPVRSK